jgi:hypothetical protein
LTSRLEEDTNETLRNLWILVIWRIVE